MRRFHFDNCRDVIWATQEIAVIGSSEPFWFGLCVGKIFFQVLHWKEVTWSQITSGALAALIKATIRKEANGCTESVQYEGPPELLAMWACLRRSGARKSKRKSRNQDVQGVRFNYGGCIFQTRNTFVACSSEDISKTRGWLGF